MGIEYVDDTVGRAKGTTEPLVSRASRLVVLSAGAFGTPSILERSGIGSRDVLTRNNVEQLVDLPGVGEHFMGLYNRMFQVVTVLLGFFRSYYDRPSICGERRCRNDGRSVLGH